MRIEALCDAASIVPGSTFTVGVRLKIDPDWHTYWLNPGEAGQATELKLFGPAGLHFGPVQWPLPMQIQVDGGVAYGYEKEVMLLVPVSTDKSMPLGKPVTINADVACQACRGETCAEIRETVSATIPVEKEAGPANTELFATWRARLPVVASDASALAVLDNVNQPKLADGTPSPSFSVQWKMSPRAVEWFPVSTRAVAIEDVVVRHVRHDLAETTIRFKPTIFKPADVPGGRLDSLLVYEGADGVRHGIMVPISVALPK